MTKHAKQALALPFNITTQHAQRGWRAAAAVQCWPTPLGGRTRLLAPDPPCPPPTLADEVHPQDRTGHAAMADLLIALVQDTARGLALRPLSADDEADAQVSAGSSMPGHAGAVQKEAEGRDRSCWRVCCLLLDTLPPAPPPARLQDGLPIPMTPGNYQRRSSACLLQREFQKVVVEQQGFTW